MQYLAGWVGLFLNFAQGSRDKHFEYKLDLFDN